MNKETVAGKFDQVSGKVKQSVGEAVGNQKLANAGVAEQVKGAAKEGWGHAKDAAKTVSDSHRAETTAQGENIRQHAEGTANEMREKITSTAQNLKEKVNNKMDEMKHRHEDHPAR
jgi:uncharacterized protein YjbJ (UPF0337 family)